MKQTLYRTSGDSPIIRALARAAQNGKEVTALVEFKARFDEWRNVNWARRLEDAGVHVIYGIAGFKTHAKALLIVRRKSQRIHRYVHLATGNYNDRTARLYSDIGLMTCDRGDRLRRGGVLQPADRLFRGCRLVEAGRGADRASAKVHRLDRPGNSGLDGRSAGLDYGQDQLAARPGNLPRLYRASQAGVQVLLNVRGICCLRPGLAGVSENIEVRSIVDRFLEHARVFYFRNGGHEEVYLSSADWMQRNLSKRLELLFPVIDPNHRRRLIEVLQTYFADNVKAWRLLGDGRYERVEQGSQVPRPATVLQGCRRCRRAPRPRPCRNSAR